METRKGRTIVVVICWGVLQILMSLNWLLKTDSSKVSPPMPPTEGRFDVVIDNDVIRHLDLSSFQKTTGIISPLASKFWVVNLFWNEFCDPWWVLFPSIVTAEPKQFLERTIGFTINYTREDPHDRRELSEYPDIRLWFVRLDSEYPWLPVLLDWRAGELARYAAMLVPHQVMLVMAC